MNLKKKIKDLNGNVVQFPGKKENETTYKTVGEFLASMLVQNNQYNNTLNFDTKMKQYKLAKKVKNGLANLDDETALVNNIDLKKVINKSNFAMLIQMQVYEEIFPEEVN